MTRVHHFLFYMVSVACGIGLIVSYANSDTIGGWDSYGSDKASTKYIPLNQINKDNVKDLRIAWYWNSIDNKILESNPDLWTMVNEATPLMVDGVLYTSTSR
jgi:quinoprotein glucose dehydrogenase